MKRVGKKSFRVKKFDPSKAHGKQLRIRIVASARGLACGRSLMGVVIDNSVCALRSDIRWEPPLIESPIDGPKSVLSGVKSFNRIPGSRLHVLSSHRAPMETSHIVIAEDDPDTRELMETVLGRAGFRVTVTGDPYEVLRLLATDRVDGLLLDYWMPKLNGIELCRLIRSTNHDVVIVFCSGSVADSDKQAAFAAGAQGFIGKPFQPQELTGGVRAALNMNGSK